MKLYVLTFEAGCINGHKILIGVFDTEEKAKEAKKKHLLRYNFCRYEYFIKEIRLNKLEKYEFARW